MSKHWLKPAWLNTYKVTVVKTTAQTIFSWLNMAHLVLGTVIE